MSYKVILNTTGLKYEASGETIEEALGNLNLEWQNIKNKGVITVEKGKDTYSHLFYRKQLTRIFANKIVRKTWAKRLELLLKEKK